MTTLISLDMGDSNFLFLDIGDVAFLLLEMGDREYPTKKRQLRSMGQFDPMLNLCIPRERIAQHFFRTAKSIMIANDSDAEYSNTTPHSVSLFIM